MTVHEQEMFAERRPYVSCAPHADPWIVGIQDLLVQTVDADSVQHLSYYNNGLADLTIDVLEHAELADRFIRKVPVAARRRDAEYFGRELSSMIPAINEMLEPMRSGPVIRAVFDVDDGALFFFQVFPGEYLAGMSLDKAAVPRADQAIAALVNQIRRLRQAAVLNPGGYLAQVGPDDPGHPPPSVSRSEHSSPIDDIFLDLASAAVRPADLHYVARFRDGGLTAVVDIFDDTSLDRFFVTISRSRRKRLYREMGERAHLLGRDLDRAVRPLLSKPLHRTVLDVEWGALYFVRTVPGEHLMGVTLNQSVVARADERLMNLAEDLQRARAGSGGTE